MKVMKFGGSSVATGERISNVADLVNAQEGSKVVVVSALGGVTDMLVDIMHKVVDLPTDVVEKEVGDFIKSMTEKHRDAASAAIADTDIRLETLEEVRRLLEKLKVALLGVGYLEDLSPKSQDYIVSFGERLSITILSGTLKSKKTESVSLTGFEAGIITDSGFGRARPDFDKTNKKVSEVMKPFLKKKVVPVVAGFVAGDRKGRITTLGRGGSDYTASIIGSALKAEEVQIWTDVDGILSTDPRIVPDARLLDKLSYVEALDLGYFGAKVIHSKMIEPAMVANVPVRVKNTFNPDGSGTLIVHEQKEVEGVIKAVAIARSVGIVNLGGVGMAATPNIAGKLFSTLGEKNINIIMISGSSESNLSFVLEEKDIEKAVKALEKTLGNGVIQGLSIIREVSIVTVVGAGMHGAKGIAGRIFSEVADAGVNIMMIAQGSSEVNIAFMVLDKDVEKAVKRLHDKFIYAGK